MQRIIVVLLAVVCHIALWAQTYQPNANWPYLLPDFEQGVIYLTNGSFSNAMLNVHLHDDKLQCLAAQKRIEPVTAYNIDYFTIGNRYYRYVDGKLMECLSQNGDNYLMLNVRADFIQMASQYIPYHLQANTYMPLDIRRLELKGEQNEKYDELRAMGSSQSLVPLVKTYWFYINGKLVLAKQKDCCELLNKQQRKMFKAYVKENHLSWSDPNALRSILSYIVKNVD